MAIQKEVTNQRTSWHVLLAQFDSYWVHGSRFVSSVEGTFILLCLSVYIFHTHLTIIFIVLSECEFRVHIFLHIFLWLPIVICDFKIRFIPLMSQISELRRLRTQNDFKTSKRSTPYSKVQSIHWTTESLKVIEIVTVARLSQGNWANFVFLKFPENLIIK